MQVSIMKLISTILIASTAAALKAPRAAPTKALQVPRGGGMVEQSTAIKAATGVFGLYSAQMLLVPSKIQNDHFEAKATTSTDFAWRGHGVSIAIGIWAITQLDTDAAFKVAMAWVAGIAVAYPYNAKFNWFDTYKVKYPMHYVPEVLMIALLGAGYIANQAE